MNNEESLLMADIYLKAAKENFCEPCCRKGQNLQPVDLERLERSTCHCDKVDYLMSVANDCLRYSEKKNNAA